MADFPSKTNQLSTPTHLLHEYAEAPPMCGSGEEEAPLLLEGRGERTVEEEHLGSRQ